jgi:hypothetical protein
LDLVRVETGDVVGDLTFFFAGVRLRLREADLVETGDGPTLGLAGDVFRLREADLTAFCEAFLAPFVAFAFVARGTLRILVEGLDLGTAFKAVAAGRLVDDGTCDARVICFLEVVSFRTLERVREDRGGEVAWVPSVLARLAAGALAPSIARSG